MQTHEYYEELCALLPIGELSGDEYLELTEHLRGCPSCRHATDDFSVILDKMPVGEADVDEQGSCRAPGTQLSNAVPRSRRGRRGAVIGCRNAIAIFNQEMVVAEDQAGAKPCSGGRDRVFDFVCAVGQTLKARVAIDSSASARKMRR